MGRRRRRRHGHAGKKVKVEAHGDALEKASIPQIQTRDSNTDGHPGAPPKTLSSNTLITGTSILPQLKLKEAVVRLKRLRAYACTSCLRIFHSSALLTRHLELSHAGGAMKVESDVSPSMPIEIPSAVILNSEPTPAPSPSIVPIQEAMDVSVLEAAKDLTNQLKDVIQADATVTHEGANGAESMEEVIRVILNEPMQTGRDDNPQNVPYINSGQWITPGVMFVHVNQPLVAEPPGRPGPRQILPKPLEHQQQQRLENSVLPKPLDQQHPQMPILLPSQHNQQLLQGLHIPILLPNQHNQQHLQMAILLPSQPDQGQQQSPQMPIVLPSQHNPQLLQGPHMPIFLPRQPDQGLQQNPQMPIILPRQPDHQEQQRPTMPVLPRLSDQQQQQRPALQLQILPKQPDQRQQQNPQIPRVLPKEPDRQQQQRPDKERFNFACSWCKSVFKTLKLLNSHRSTSHAQELERNRTSQENPVNEHKCGICDEVFESASTLLAHIPVHTPALSANLYIQCLVCLKLFLTMQGLDQHQRKSHPKQDEVNSTKSAPHIVLDAGSNSDFPRKPDVIRSTASHLENILKHYPAELAGSFYTIGARVEDFDAPAPEANADPIVNPSSSTVNAEGSSDCIMVNSTNNADMSSDCIILDSADTKEMLPGCIITNVTSTADMSSEPTAATSTMEEKERPKKKKLRECILCPEMFRTRIDLIQHLEEIHHTEGIKLECKICKSQFDTCAEFKEHKKTHVKTQCSNFNIEPEPCLEPQLSELQKALTSTSELQCEQCPSVFNHTASLRVHVRLCHSNKTICTATETGMSVATSIPAVEIETGLTPQDKQHSSSRLHNLLSSPVSKPDPCEACGVEFGFRHQLVEHIREFHRGEYECCGLIFTRKMGFLAHQIRHNSDTFQPPALTNNDILIPIPDQPSTSASVSLSQNLSGIEYSYSPNTRITIDEPMDTSNGPETRIVAEKLPQVGGKRQRDRGNRKGVCLLCNKEYVYLTQHLNLVHFKVQQQQELQQKQKQPKRRRKRQRQEQQLQPQQFECATCKERFNSSQDLKRHELIHQTPIIQVTTGNTPAQGQISCSYCGLPYKSEWLKRMHENIYHKPKSAVLEPASVTIPPDGVIYPGTTLNMRNSATSTGGNVYVTAQGDAQNQFEQMVESIIEKQLNS